MMVAFTDLAERPSGGNNPCLAWTDIKPEHETEHPLKIQKAPLYTVRTGHVVMASLSLFAPNQVFSIKICRDIMAVPSPARVTLSRGPQQLSTTTTTTNTGTPED